MGSAYPECAFERADAGWPDDISRSEKSRDPQVAGSGRVFIGYRHRLSYFRLGMAQAVGERPNLDCHRSRDRVLYQMAGPDSEIAA